MVRSRGARLCAMLAACLVWAGLASAAQAEGPATRFVLSVTAVAEFTPAFVALDQRFFAKRGLDVTLQIAPNSATLVPAMLSGSVQVGGPPAPVFLPAIAQGLPIACFAAAALIDPDHPTGSVLVRPELKGIVPKDFEGKRLAVSGINSIMHVLLREWLTARKVDSARIFFVEVPFSRMADSLKAGAVDGVVEVEPFISRITEAGTGVVGADFYRELPAGMLTTAYCSPRDWATANPAAIAAFRAALEEAGTLISADPKHARAILARSLKLSETVAADLPMGIFRFNLTGEQITQWTQILRRQGLLDDAIDPRQVLLD